MYHTFLPRSASSESHTALYPQVPISLPVTIDMTGSLGIQSDIVKVPRGGDDAEAA